MNLLDIINSVFQDVQRLDIQPTEHNVTSLARIMQNLRIIAQTTDEIAKKLDETQQPAADAPEVPAAEEGEADT